MGGRLWRTVSAAAVALGAGLLSGCDGPAQFYAIRAHILVHDDGTGELWFRVPGQIDDGAFAAFVAEYVAALGLTPADIDIPPRGPVHLSGLPRDRIEVDLVGLQQFATERWPEQSASVFVALCTPRDEGAPGGVGIHLDEAGTCALYDSEEREMGATAQAFIVFEPRWPLGLAEGLGIVLVAVAGVVAWEVRRRLDEWNGWRLALGPMTLMAPVACAILAMMALGKAETENGTSYSFEAGISFDHGGDQLSGPAGLTGLLIAVGLVLYYYLRGSRPKPAPEGELLRAE